MSNRHAQGDRTRDRAGGIVQGQSREHTRRSGLDVDLLRDLLQTVPPFPIVTLSRPPELSMNRRSLHRRTSTLSLPPPVVT